MPTTFGKSDLPSDIEALCSDVIKAAIDVHREIGPGLLESIYERAMIVELERRAVPAQRQVEVPILYRGQRIGDHRIDLLVGSMLVVELKSVTELLPIHAAQTLTYLRIGRFPLGLLINFNVPLVRHGLRRILNPQWRSVIVPNASSPRLLTE